MADTRAAHQSNTLQLDLPSGLARLRALPPGHGVLSAYVDTSPGRLSPEAYLLAFRDGCKVLRGRVALDDTDAFEAAVEKAERYLTQALPRHQRGLALFAVPGKDLVVIPLPKAPAEDVAWGELPEMAPLEQLLDDNERVAVLLFGNERARLFSVFLGEIDFRQSIEDEVPCKQATGGWFGLQQTGVARHRVDHIRRHAERSVLMLMDALRSRPFDRLLLAGSDEALAVLRHELPRPLRARLEGTLDLEVFAGEATVLTAVLSAAEAIEREREQRLVDELLESAITPHAVLGLAGTLGALAGGRVHVLVLANTFAEPGGSCSTCGRLVTDEHRCPTCGLPTEPLADLHESVLRQAHEQGAKVEMVSGLAATRLSNLGGIGAWTRF